MVPFSTSTRAPFFLLKCCWNQGRGCSGDEGGGVGGRQWGWWTIMLLGRESEAAGRVEMVVGTWGLYFSNLSLFGFHGKQVLTAFICSTKKFSHQLQWFNLKV